MPYRSAAHGPEAAVTVRYGPFRLRALDLGLGVAGLVVLGVAGLLALAEPDRVVCMRGDGAVVCESGRAGRFGVEDVDVVRFVPYEGGKGSERGRTELIDRIGRSRVLFDGPRKEAREGYEAFDAFLRDASRERFEHALPRSWVAALFLGLLGVFALAAGLTALRQTTSVRLLVWPRRRRMRVVRRWMGIPRGTTERSLEGVEDVEVERGELRSWTQRRQDAPRPAGRLLLVTHDGSRIPVVERFLPGTDVHDRAAAELSACLGQAEEADAEGAPERTPGDATRGRRGWTRSPVVRYLMFVGGMVAVAFGAQAALDLYVSRTQGFLEVRCAHRCRMGAMECLPGGSWRSSFDPGTYAIEIWNPDVQDGWERVEVRVDRGRTTTFVCRQGAGDH